jgi:hypothetical protein
MWGYLASPADDLIRAGVFNQIQVLSGTATGDGLMKATVDRFEEDQAVILLRDDKRVQLVIPRALLPPLDEGDILEITIERNEPATREAEERALEILKRLKEKDL